MPSLDQRAISILSNDLAGLDSGSNERIEAIHSLLLNISGSDVQEVIDVLDSTLDTVKADTHLYQKLLYAFRGICGRWELIPSTCVLPEGLEKDCDLPTARGDSAEVWEGSACGHGHVAIKAFRDVALADLNNRNKAFYYEVALWKHLPHPSIVPFLGAAKRAGPRPSYIVSPWMANGTMPKYLRDNPHTNRRMVLKDICGGIQFLHSLGIVHGDLKGASILIDEDGKARLIDFGRASMRGDLEMVAEPAEASYPRESYRWMAPEVPGNSVSQASDIYALAMVIIELFSGKLPFHNHPETAVPPKVIRGIRPERPGHDSGLSDDIWRLVEQCWQEDKAKRPTISVVLGRL